MSAETHTIARPAIARAADLASRLDDGLDALGCPLPAPARAQLIAFLSLLSQWNRVYNLTSVRDPADMLAVHLLDALSIVGLIDDVIDGGTLLDVGSGAGIPGIPLAIARPDWGIDSIDAVAKKIGFQLRAKQALRLDRFEPHHARVEALTLAACPAVIVARAYASLTTLVQSVGHLTDARTTIVAMKGAEPTAEIAALPATWVVARTVTLDVPFLGAARCAVVLKRA